MLDFKKKIRSIPDWPQKGVIFRDITPVLQDKRYLQTLIRELTRPYRKKKVDVVVGIDARGFLFASAVACRLRAGLSIIRKKGKLPYKTLRKKYTLEYAANVLEMHKDAVSPGQRVLMVDDLLATGGTMKAAVDIVKKLGGKIVGIVFFIELADLKGRKKLKGYKITSLVKY